MSTDHQELITRLQAHEGLVLKVYDDATGHLVRPGVVIVGHPTIGFGRALDVRGISFDEATAFLTRDLAECRDEVAKWLPWSLALDPRRQGVLIEMCYQMGLGNLLKFKTFLGYLQQRDFLRAGAAMVQSKWARTQSPKRAARLRDIIETGEAR